MENAQAATPEQIAQAVFAEAPADPCTRLIVSENSGADACYLFELTITIFMEGLGVLTNNLADFDLSTLNEKSLLSVQPWMNSLGLKVNVSKHSKETMGYDYYCRVALEKQEPGFFAMRNIDKFYTFRLNGNSMDECRAKENLNEIHALFRNGDDHYRISFDFYH